MTAQPTLTPSAGGASHRPTELLMSRDIGSRLRQIAGMVGCATAFAALSSFGASGPSLAQTPAPAANHVWGGCVLSDYPNDTVAGLEHSIAAGSGIVSGGVRVGFVVVYALRDSPTDNNGQPLDSGFTGPIICINPDEVEITGFEADGESPPLLTEASDIPTDTDPGGAGTVDLLTAKESFIVKYQLNGGVNDGNIEKRICHTVAGNTDCFIVRPIPSE